MLEIPMILVPLTIQLIFTPDFPYSINAGSTFIDMEPSAESTNTRFSELVFIYRSRKYRMIRMLNKGFFFEKLKIEQP